MRVEEHEKERVCQELQNLRIKHSEASFRRTLTEVLDERVRQAESEQAMLTNMSMLSFQYTHIVGYWRSSYNDFFKEFQRVHDIYFDEDDFWQPQLGCTIIWVYLRFYAKSSPTPFISRSL